MSSIHKVLDPTLNTTAYGAGDALHTGAIEMTDVFTDPGASVDLETVTVTDLEGQSAAMDILVFDADPSASTITINLAIAIHADDLQKYRGHIPIVAGDYSDLGTPSGATKRGPVLSIANPGTKSLWIVLVTRGTPTHTATGLHLEFQWKPTT